METAAITPLFMSEHLRTLPESGIAQARATERATPAADGGASAVELRDSVVLSFSAVERLDAARRDRQPADDQPDDDSRRQDSGAATTEEPADTPRRLGKAFVPGPAEMVGTPEALRRYDDNGDGHIDLLETKRVLRAEEEISSYRAVGAPGPTRGGEEAATPSDEPAPYEPRRLSEDADAPPLPGEDKLFGEDTLFGDGGPFAEEAAWPAERKLYADEPGAGEDRPPLPGEDRLYDDVPPPQDDKIYADAAPPAPRSVYGAVAPAPPTATVTAYAAVVEGLSVRHGLDQTA